MKTFGNLSNGRTDANSTRLSHLESGQSLTGSKRASDGFEIDPNPNKKQKLIPTKSNKNKINDNGL